MCCVDTCTYLHLILLRKFFIFFMVLGSFIFKGSFPSKCSEHVVLLHFMMLWLDLSFSVCLCMVGWRGRSGNQMRHSDEVSLKDLESQATSWWHLFLFSFPLPCKPSHSVGVEQQQVSLQPFYFSCLRKEAVLWYHHIWNTVKIMTSKLLENLKKFALHREPTQFSPFFSVTSVDNSILSLHPGYFCSLCFQSFRN